MGRGRESESNVQLSFPVVSVNLSYLFTSGSVTVNLLYILYHPRYHRTLTIRIG